MAAEETLTPEQQNELLFTQLILMFQGAAYQHMGKVMNPVTNKVERDLGQAKHAIDMLGMLEAKTKGNLTDNESRLVEHVLYEVRMNYVDEMNKAEGEPEEKDAPTDEAAADTGPDEKENPGDSTAGDPESGG
jgi:hypothetical protein